MGTNEASPMMTNRGHRVGTLSDGVDRNLRNANDPLLCVPKRRSGSARATEGYTSCPAGCFRAGKEMTVPLYSGPHHKSIDFCFFVCYLFFTFARTSLLVHTPSVLERAGGKSILLPVAGLLAWM